MLINSEMAIHSRVGGDFLYDTKVHQKRQRSVIGGAIVSFGKKPTSRGG